MEDHVCRIASRPLLVQRLRKHVFRVRALYDLGAGTHVDSGSYRLLQDEGVREVYVIDPALKLSGTCRSPRVFGLKSETGAPVGLPAMMLQPGFTLSSKEHLRYTRAPMPMPTWESTLELLKPSWIVWSSYHREEQKEDSLWLSEHGYTSVDFVEPRESKDWHIEGTGITYCATISVARREPAVG
jgi:hypothetical protein